MDEEGIRGRPDILEEALSAVRRQQGADQVPATVVDNTLQALSQLAKARPTSWKERIRRMWRKEAQDGGTPSRRPIARFAAVAAALVVLNTAGIIWIHHDLLAKAHQKIRVLSALPAGGQVDEADRFVLVFDEPVVSPREVGKPLDRRPFVLAPQPAGQWQWAATDRLEFVLARKLPPGRVFTLKPAMEMEALTGRQVVGPAEFRFQTKPLALQGCALENTDKTSVHFSLRFNQPVRPSDLMKNITVYDANGGADLKPACLSQDSADRIVLRANRPGNTLCVRLSGSLAGEGGQVPLGGDLVTSVVVPLRFTLLGAEVERPGLEKEISVTVRFSQALAGGVEPDLRVSPPLDGNAAHVKAQVMNSSQLLVRGHFECGKRYTLTVPGTLSTYDGHTLGEDRSVSFEIPNRSPELSFAASKGILSPAGNMLVDMEAVNVQAVELSSSRVHANNIVTYLRRPRDVEGTARELTGKTVPLDLPANTPGKVALDLKGVIDQTTGVYRVVARMADPEHSWNEDSVIVAVTDLGITAKRHKEGYFVWVTSIATAKPVGGVTVRAFTYNNQVIAEAQTDGDGTALLAANFDHPDGPAWVITAEKERDLSFLQLEKGGRHGEDDDDSDPADYQAALADASDSSDSASAERPRPKSYEVMLYAERGIYRPGDTIHITGIVRDARGTVPPPFPMTVCVTRPDGREVAHLPVTMALPGQGIFQVDYTSPADGQTGEYTFEATLPGSHVSLGTEEVLVEAFVPVRLEVKAAPTKPRYGADDTIEANVSARYLFGQPGAGLPFHVMGGYHPVPFTSDKFKDFTFGQARGRRIREGFMGAEGELDDAGAASPALSVPDFATAGLWRGDMSASVTEPGGRTVSASFSFLLDLDDCHIGLRLPASRIVPTNAPVKLDWVRVDPNGEPARGKATLEYELSRVEWDWVLERVNGQPVWKSKERLFPAGKGSIKAPGAKGTVTVRCPLSGRYRLVVRKGAADEAPAPAHPQKKGGPRVASIPRPPAAPAPVESDSDEDGTSTAPQTVVEFYASDAREAPGTLVEEPDKVEVVLDHGRYLPGAVAKVLIRSPYRGTLLLTVETDRVIDQQVLEMTDKTIEMELPVPYNLRGGAFVTATVLRAVDPHSDKWLPVRASGSAHLVTDHSNRIVPLTLEAPAKVRPGQKIHVSARAGCVIDPANPPVVHLWAVDEGILLCTDYQTPGPLGYFLGQRPHEVKTADLFNDLLPDYKRPADIHKIGADGGDERESRRSILPIRTTQAAVVWNKALPVGPDGTLSADLELPEFTGELRLMAVAVAGDDYGSAQKPITVASPLMVEASWPRFASPGDKFQVPVKLFNNTPQSVTVRLSLRSAGPVSASVASAATATATTGAETTRAPLRVAAKQQPASAGAAETADLGEYEILPGKPRTVWLDAQADAMGQVTADIVASPTPAATDELPQSHAHAELTIRPASPIHSLARIIALKAGEGIRLDALAEFFPGTLRRTVEVSGQPNVQLRSAVEALLDYPYGCVEQTSSRLYGILYAPDLLILETPLSQGEPGAKVSDARVEEAGRMIHSGILRLWSMQTRSGGMAYWPGGTEDCLWPSAYVGGLLAEAQRLGYSVEKEFSENLCGYLLRKLNEPSRGAANELPDNLRAEICRVLAAFGKPQQGWMNRLSEKVDDLDVAGRAHLASAFALAGRKDLALKVLPENTMALAIPTSTGGRITSETAQYAALLAALMDIQPDHPWVGLLADRLNKNRAATGRWGTTLENAMCIAALAKYQTAHKEKSEFTGTMTVEGGQPVAFDSNRPARIKIADDKPLSVETAGTGPVYLHVKAEGLAKEPPKPYDRGLEVRRRWTDLAGREVDPAKVRVGDLIVAEVYFRAVGLPELGAVENVAIVDALPGGVEVENTRLAVSVKVALPPLTVPLLPGFTVSTIPSFTPAQSPVTILPPVLVSPPLAVSRAGGPPRSTASAPATSSAPSTGPAQAASAPAVFWALPDALRPRDGAETCMVDRVEWLDDRVVIFTSVTSKPQAYRYLLRATCSGTFRLPQLQASCMYDPAFASLHGGGEVTVAK